MVNCPNKQRVQFFGGGGAAVVVHANETGRQGDEGDWHSVTAATTVCCACMLVLLGKSITPGGSTLQPQLQSLRHTCCGVAYVCD